MCCLKLGCRPSVVNQRRRTRGIMHL
jgi:hypothetical protein